MHKQMWKHQSHSLLRFDHIPSEFRFTTLKFIVQINQQGKLTNFVIAPNVEPVFVPLKIFPGGILVISKPLIKAYQKPFFTKNIWQIWLSFLEYLIRQHW